LNQVSEVVEVGSDVRSYRKGDTVINTYARIGSEVKLGSWCTQRVIDEKYLFSIPRNTSIDLQQIAMLMCAAPIQ